MMELEGGETPVIATHLTAAAKLGHEAFLDATPAADYCLLTTGAATEVAARFTNVLD